MKKLGFYLDFDVSDVADCRMHCMLLLYTTGRTMS